MSNTIKPFNIRLISPTKEKLGYLPRITSPETYDGIRTELHPEGLFSTAMFGDKGEERRDRTLGYISLNTEIMHPMVCHWLKQLKRIHEEIWTGKCYAIFDEKLGEFLKVEPTDERGRTGYSFFVSHLDKLKLKPTKSVKRTTIIEAYNKYKEQRFLKYYLVLPPGLRDIQVEEDGRTSEDEINEYYRKLVRYASILENTPKNQGSELDVLRSNMQITANQIDAYIEKIQSGKKGFLAGKWAARNIADGTRNVIGSMDTSVEDLDDPRAVTVDTVIMGLYQTLKAVRPIVLHLFKHSRFYQLAFSGILSGQAMLINPKTLVRESVTLDAHLIDRWTSISGIDKLTDQMEKETFRSSEMRVAGYYFGLIYEDGEKYQLLGDISELPEGWDKKYVRPIKYAEFFYLIGKDRYQTAKVQVTRYPVIGDGSVYIGNLYCKTTVTGRILQEYDQGEKVEGSLAKEFPDLQNSIYHDVASPHPSRLSGLDGDFDGDKISSNALYTDDAVNEADAHQHSSKSLLMAGGQLTYDFVNDVVKRAVAGLTQPSTGQVRSQRDNPNF